jgi:hypothetical protein
MNPIEKPAHGYARKEVERRLLLFLDVCVCIVLTWEWDCRLDIGDSALWESRKFR